ncbi:hydrogenase accessory protein HypB [Blastopirellula marina]|uniref:Hydrogenase accessory protein HypB n=1 Tax=Blastopirellula marina TaxID=124 RepID=A0A2S8F0H5_9BACT|nr:MULTISPECIES: hydrogenase nickel incorporation protein HypB [Pirellulaceae]PQO25640.1 hydrogenase accessory protein HypB [Blastopirellula marina]RCS43323.1 hydrogenase accessory protein HypB [Bremerella cremea]
MSTETISVNQDIRTLRREAAEAFQMRMQDQGTYVVRLLSSPGSGKTTLLEETTKRLGKEYRVGILVGDIATNRDAERLSPLATTAQITTGGACHLELPLVEKILPQLGQSSFEFLFIEDVGNLVCPASHDLGEHLRTLVLSTTEGDDKPGKYPKAFRTSQAVVINKIDLLPYVPFSVERAMADARDVHGDIDFFPMSALSGEGVELWCDYLRLLRNKMMSKCANSIPE